MCFPIFSNVVMGIRTNTKYIDLMDPILILPKDSETNLMHANTTREVL